MTKLIFGSMSLTKCAPWVTLRGKIVDEPLGADGGEDQGYELMLMERQECRGWVGADMVSCVVMCYCESPCLCCWERCCMAPFSCVKVCER